jgi:hypothetical protein
MLCDEKGLAIPPVADLSADCKRKARARVAILSYLADPVSEAEGSQARPDPSPLRPGKVIPWAVAAEVLAGIRPFEYPLRSDVCLELDRSTRPTQRDGFSDTVEKPGGAIWGDVRLA